MSPERKSEDAPDLQQIGSVQALREARLALSAAREELAATRAEAERVALVHSQNLYFEAEIEAAQAESFLQLVARLRMGEVRRSEEYVELLDAGLAPILEAQKKREAP